MKNKIKMIFTSLTGTPCCCSGNSVNKVSRERLCYQEVHKHRTKQLFNSAPNYELVKHAGSITANHLSLKQAQGLC